MISIIIYAAKQDIDIENDIDIWKEQNVGNTVSFFDVN